MADHMRTVLDPFRFLLVAVSGWMNQRQLEVIDYLREESRVLREQLGGRGLLWVAKTGSGSHNLI